MLFHHLGIFVKSIDKSTIIFSRDLKAKKTSEVIVDKDLGVRVQFFKDVNGITYELVEGLGKKNPVKNILASSIRVISSPQPHIDDLKAQRNNRLINFVTNRSRNIISLAS